MQDLNIRAYDKEVREVAHDMGYIIINQSYWYPETKYTEQEAMDKFLCLDK